MQARPPSPPNRALRAVQVALVVLAVAVGCILGTSIADALQGVLG